MPTRCEVRRERRKAALLTQKKELKVCKKCIRKAEDDNKKLIFVPNEFDFESEMTVKSELTAQLSEKDNQILEKDNQLQSKDDIIRELHEQIVTVNNELSLIKDQQYLNGLQEL